MNLLFGLSWNVYFRHARNRWPHNFFVTIYNGKKYWFEGECVIYCFHNSCYPLFCTTLNPGRFSYYGSRCFCWFTIHTFFFVLSTDYVFINCIYLYFTIARVYFKLCFTFSLVDIFSAKYLILNDKAFLALCKLCG
jgi:hypothetical protein